MRQSKPPMGEPRPCAECGKEFTPVSPRFFICPECWKAEYQQGVKCAATKDNGAPCNGWAMQGRVFCHSHLRQGYGLFELAVRENRERQAA